MLSLLDFFATYVLHGRQAPAAEHAPVPSSKGARHATESDWKTYLLRLTQRVHALHCRARQDSKLNAHGITDAVQIWNDLASWKPGKEQLSTDEEIMLFGSCQSAIFIWTYFLMHPDDMEGWKARQSLKDILSNLAEIEVPELAPLMAIPLFFAGLTATEPDDIKIINEMYEQLEEVTQHKALKDSWRILQRVWGEGYRGTRPSWDWIR
ncbi:uncharacterized protein KD926_005018 [Aspergillus affinis]|uniref:uncharacterized protein n=1 Tax=Aspergillus affinis TaxID=1070780 RepID=UPI0022FEC182|nr:uncharacterized protein KD926_005018 [Aspergillus affinis]KAI9034924.1 hypothetical protein KD926_005018 [Aspergillus affinis]